MAGFSLSGSKEHKYRLMEFHGGLNTKHNPESLVINESPELLNVVFDEKGKFRKRPGVYAEMDFPFKAGYQICDMFDYTKRNGTVITLVIFTDGTIQTWDGTTKQTISLKLADSSIYYHNNMKFSRFVFNDILYFGTKIDGWFKFTGGTEANLVPTIPKCDYAVVKNNRVYYGGEFTQPDRLSYSHQGNPENVDTIKGTDETDANVGGVIDFLSEDVYITGLAHFQGDILVFKKDGVFRLSGDDYTDFAVNRLNVATGNIARNGVVKGDNVVYYIGQNGVYYIYNSQQDIVEVTPLSDMVTSEFEEGNITLITSRFHHGKLYLLFTDKTLIYDERMKVWTKWDTIFTCSVINETYNTLLFGGNQGYVYSLSNSLRDEWTAGVYTPITAKWSSAYLSFEMPEMTKRMKWAKIFYQPNPIEGSKIDIEVWIDYTDQYKALDVYYDGLVWEEDEDTEDENNWGDEYWGEMRSQMSKKLRFGGSGEFVKLVFKNDKIDEELSISGIVFGFKLKNKVR